MDSTSESGRMATRSCRDKLVSWPPTRLRHSHRPGDYAGDCLLCMDRERERDDARDGARLLAAWGAK